MTSLGMSRTLEWDRLIQLAQLEARSDPAKATLTHLLNPEEWATDLSSARQMQQETQEVTPLLDRDALWGPLMELSDPSDALERLDRGSVLETADLLLLRSWIYAVDSWIQIPREEIRGEKFRKALTQLPDPYNILKILTPVLTPEGELSEKASPKLASLNAEIRSLKREIGTVLDQLLKSFSQKGILQESFTDVRDGRYVLPIKISAQNEIDGTIYEASASRQTVFIEPKEVASLNNRLRQKQNDLIQEIYIVLEGVSKNLLPFVAEISLAVNSLVHWDTVQSKARLGRRYSGKPIQVTEERTFLLKQTAHPILWWALPPDSIIRNEIDFLPPSKALLLTGPNTGGKTVLLKTLGIAGICARTGFPFPATDHPTVPFFDSFFADLGDPQSIEHHLSSFSGHVLRFKQILEQVTDQSLILIDELNSATDPEEGAAFGRAVLETILSKNAMIVTTTHDPHLKALAVTDTRILNASMAFDENSRIPTYKMIIGIPGRSRALETAERLGIPAEIIQLAKKYLSHEHKEFERLLAQLESDIQETTRARKEVFALHEEAERLKKEWTERTEISVQDMMEKTRHKLRRILEQAQDDVRSTIRKLDEMNSRKEIDKARSSLSETFTLSASLLESALAEEAPLVAATLARKKSAIPEEMSSPKKIEVGGTVRIPKWKTTGVVLEISGSKVKVAMGTLQMTLSPQEIQPTGPTPSKSPGSLSQGSESHSSYVPPSQIDLRGIRFEEAMSQLERYLDLAFRSRALAEVVIIHGLGTGALREGTYQLLRKLPYVKSSRSGGPGQGGAGATFVEFDQN